MTAKKSAALRVVDGVAEQAVDAAIAEPAPPVTPTVLAIDPLSEFRADQQRRKMDAQGEIDLLTEQERLADAALAAKIKSAEDALARMRSFETQKRDAEHRQIAIEIERYRQIILGAEAALEATDPPAEMDTAI